MIGKCLLDKVKADIIIRKCLSDKIKADRIII